MALKVTTTEEAIRSAIWFAIDMIDLARATAHEISKADDDLLEQMRNDALDLLHKARFLTLTPF